MNPMLENILARARIQNILEPPEEGQEKWTQIRAVYLERGWPEILAAFYAHYKESNGLSVENEEAVDEALKILRDQGLTVDTIRGWAESEVYKAFKVEKTHQDFKVALDSFSREEM